LADLFNTRRPPKPIAFILPFVIELLHRDSKPLFNVEPLLTGEYEKHNDNSGGVYQSTALHFQRNTPQAFSHFTWEASGKTLCVCDIQGVGDLYTDPQASNPHLILTSFSSSSPRHHQPHSILTSSSPDPHLTLAPILTSWPLYRSPRCIQPMATASVRATAVGLGSISSSAHTAAMRSVSTWASLRSVWSRPVSRVCFHQMVSQAQSLNSAGRTIDRSSKRSKPLSILCVACVPCLDLR